MFSSSSSSLVTLLATTMASMQSAAAVESTVLWQDDFDTPTKPSAEYWSFDTGAGGWGNNELQEYTTNNALVTSGILKITALRHGDTFTSSRINTQDKVEFKYGTVEARIKVPNVEGGLWPAFWTLGYNFPQVPWPACGELDIMEIGQGSAGDLINKRVVSAAHWKHGEDVIASWPGNLDFGSYLYDDYHVYSLDWTPELLVTYLDGIEIWSMNITLSECTSCQELHHPHFLLLNLAVGGGFTMGNHSSCGYSSSNSGGGCPAPTPDDIDAEFPAVMEVDYVRLVDNGYTEVFLTPPKAETPVAENGQVTMAPTDAPTFAPTDAPTETDDYYDDKWKGSGKSSKGKGGKGGKGKSSGDVLCGEGKGKSGKGMNSKSGKGKSGSKSGKGMSKSGKSKGKTSKKEFTDCGASTSLRTTNRLGSSAVRPHWSTWLSAVLVIPALLWA